MKTDVSIVRRPNILKWGVRCCKIHLGQIQWWPELCGCGVDYSIKTKVNVGWHGDTRHRLHYTAWHLDSNITASYPNEDVSVSLQFVTLGTTGGLAIFGPVMLRLDMWYNNISDVVFKYHIQLTRLIGKSHAVHMWGLERALMVSWPRDGAVHMYSLQRVQLVSRPWDRGKIDPGHSLSTAGMCGLLWTSFALVKEVVVFTNRVAMSCGQGICRVACTGFSPNKLAWPTLLDQEFEIVVGCLQLDWPADFVSVPRSRATFFAPTRYGRFDFRKSRCFSVNTHECSCCILRGAGEVAATLNCRIGVLGGSYDNTTRGKRSSTHVPIAGKHSSGRHMHGPELSTQYRDSQGWC